jgi:RsmE family RNA methyltransferase
VSSYTPLSTEHSVREDYSETVREKSLERLQDACKQSRSAWIMTLEPARELGDLRLKPQSSFVLDVGGASIWSLPPYDGQPINLLFGPEAGWSDAEREGFKAQGLRRLGLSANHLRMETAAILGAGFILEWMRRRS